VGGDPAAAALRFAAPQPLFNLRTETRDAEIDSGLRMEGRNWSSAPGMDEDYNTLRFRYEDRDRPDM